MCGFQKILRQKKYFALWDILFNFFHLLSNKEAMTMIKTSSRNQIDLTNIADKRTEIMITANE